MAGGANGSADTTWQLPRDTGRSLQTVSVNAENACSDGSTRSRSDAWQAGAVIWKLGYDPGHWDQVADPKVRSTVLRDGNFDYVTGEVRWDRTTRPLPASLYLTGKPAFFGDEPWPWVDPTGQRKLGTLPAKRLVGQPPTPGQ